MRGVERNDGMPAVVLAPRQANIANHADQASAGDQCPVAMPPNLVEPRQEGLVVVHVTELALVVAVLLQRPVGRRGDNQVHGLVGEQA